MCNHFCAKLRKLLGSVKCKTAWWYKAVYFSQVLHHNEQQHIQDMWELSEGCALITGGLMLM